MKAVISAYARSPFHFSRKGKLAEVRPDDNALSLEILQAVQDNL